MPVIVRDGPNFLGSLTRPIFSNDAYHLVFADGAGVYGLTVFESSAVPLRYFRHGFLSRYSSHAGVVVVSATYRFHLLSRGRGQGL